MYLFQLWDSKPSWDPSLDKTAEEGIIAIVPLESTTEELR